VFISPFPEWPVIELGTICSFKNGLNFNRGASGFSIKIIGVGDFQNHLYAPLSNLNEVLLDEKLSEDYLVKTGDILFVRSNGNPDLVGRSIIVSPTEEAITFSGFTIRGRFDSERALPLFYAHFFKSRDFAEMIKTVGQGANIRNLSQAILSELKVPLPPLDEQKGIVAEIEAEQTLISGNRQLTAHFEQKIQSKIVAVWGQEQSANAEG
jgi:type I restriction enzyme M protein